MKTTITAKNMTVTNGITERVNKKVSKMERYLNPNTEILVRLTKEKNNRRTCEITVPFEGVLLRAEASNDDNLYISIDQALAPVGASDSQAPHQAGKAPAGTTPLNPTSWNTAPMTRKPWKRTVPPPRSCATRPSRYVP